MLRPAAFDRLDTDTYHLRASARLIRIGKYTPYANVILTVRDRVLMAGR